MIKYQKNGRQTSKGGGFGQISNKLKDSPIGKGIYNYFKRLVFDLLNLNENITSFIYVMITILLIVHIILFINATIKFDRYSEFDGNKSFFNNYPDFQYLKNDYLMEIDAFFLNQSNPFPYIFIFYPILIFIFICYFKIKRGNNESNIPDIEYRSTILIILILFISLGYFASFNIFHYSYIKLRIDELRKTIKEKIIELNTESDLYKNHRGDFLNRLKDIIIYEIDHDIPYNINDIAEKVFKQMQIIKPDVKPDDVNVAINAGNSDKSKINILNIIYAHKKPEIAGKYFSLLIDETYDENKVSYSLYYILGKFNINFVNNNIIFDEQFYKNFKSLIEDLDDKFRNYLNDYTKNYYIILLSFSSLLFLLILGLYRSNINKVFMDFCRYYQMTWLFVLVIFYIAIILSFITYHLESDNKDKWIGFLVLILIIITVIIFFEQIRQIPSMFKSQ